jgi:hypothetical protein
MKKLMLVLSVAVFAATLATAVHAAPGGTESNHLVSVGLGGGVSVPMSGAKDAFKNGVNGQGFVRFNLRGMPVVPRLDFSFTKFDVSSAKLKAPGVPSSASGTGQLMAGVANLQFFLLRGPVRPYLIAGIGAYSLETEVTDIPGATSTTDTRMGGLLVKLGGVASLYVEGRLDNVYSEKGFVDSKQIQLVPVTFGIVF